jgi:hypothetical protein
MVWTIKIPKAPHSFAVAIKPDTAGAAQEAA